MASERRKLMSRRASAAPYAPRPSTSSTGVFILRLAIEDAVIAGWAASAQAVLYKVTGGGPGKPPRALSILNRLWSCVSERRPCSVTSLADGVTLRSLPPPRIKIEDVIPRRAERGRPDFADRDLGENLPRLRFAPVVGAVADGPWPDRVVVAAVRGKCSGVRCALGGTKGSGGASDGCLRQTARFGLFFCFRRQFKG